MEFQILDALQKLHNPILDKIMVFFTTLGNAGAIWIVIGLVLLLCSKKYKKAGISVLLSLILGALITNLLLKNIVARQRPSWINTDIPLLIANPTDYSFPSGHTMAGFATATALFLYNRKLGIAAYILASVIAFSRLYLYVHFPTDVLGGIIVGVVSGVVMTDIVKNYKKECK